MLKVINDFDAKSGNRTSTATERITHTFKGAVYTLEKL